MYNTIHVNLWAGPGTGKSVTAAEIFSFLKKNHITCELVREYAKDLVWENRLSVTEQFLITAEQFRRESLLEGMVEVVIADYALPMGILHQDLNYSEELISIVKKLTSKWQQIDFFLSRDISNSYSPNGRIESLFEAQEKQDKFKTFAEKYCPNLHHIRLDENDSFEKITQTIINKLKLVQ